MVVIILLLSTVILFVLSRRQSSRDKLLLELSDITHMNLLGFDSLSKAEQEEAIKSKLLEGRRANQLKLEVAALRLNNAETREERFSWNQRLRVIAREHDALMRIELKLLPISPLK